MTFDDIITRLDKYAKTINRAIIGVAVFEAVIVVFIGVVSNNLTTSNPTLNKVCLYSLVVLTALYLLLLFIRTAYTASFPGSITNELKSERELQILKRDVARQETISEFFVLTMQRLNGQTCALNVGDDTNLCDKGIQQGIRDLIEPVIENAYFLLDTINHKFTIGVYLNSYRSMSRDKDSEQGVIWIDDKLDKRTLLEKDIFENSALQGEQLALQSAIRQSFNNTEFVKQDYSADGNNFTIVCSPMPLACDENYGLGVLFIISKQVNTIPTDLPTKLTIFNRVIANWIYRYNECINSRQARNA